MENIRALNWINNRLLYMCLNCNLKDKDIKEEFDVLKYVKELLEVFDESI